MIKLITHKYVFMLRGIFITEFDSDYCQIMNRENRALTVLPHPSQLGKFIVTYTTVMSFK